MLPNFIDIQGYIEEKRLVFGKKLEDFLIRNSNIFLVFLQRNIKKFTNSQYFLSISCIFIIFVSILAQSSRDIGYQSAFDIEMSQQILAGKKYSSLAIYLNFLPVYLSQILDLNSIILTQIFMNLIGVLSLFCCYKLLDKKLHLIIIGFCVGYFLRIYTLQFNEFATKSSWLLAFLFPYISCQFIEIKSRKIKILQWFLAFLIIVFNPHYGIFVLVFELYNFGKKNIFIYVGIFAFLLIFGQGFLLNFSSLFEVIKFDIFPIALFLLIFSDKLKGKKNLLIAVFCAQIVVLSELSGEYGQRFLIYSIFFPLLFLISREGISLTKKDLLWFLPFLILLQFDTQNIVKIVLNLCCFWWIILFFQKNIRFDLIFFALFSIALFYLDNQGKIAWIFCAFMVLYLVKFKIIKSHKILTALLLSYFLSLVFAAIFNYQRLYAYDLKTPNQISDAKIEIINKYAKDKDAQVTMISDEIRDFQPVFLYTNKVSNFESLKFKELIKNKKNLLIFSKKNYYSKDACLVSLLEINLRDLEFARIFTKNYRFVTEIYRLYPIKRNNFQSSKINEIKVIDDEIKLDEFEIYVRK